MEDPKQVRETLGLNQTKMARAMGVHRQTWVKWERGEQGISACPARFLAVLVWIKKIGLLHAYLKKFG